MYQLSVEERGGEDDTDFFGLSKQKVGLPSNEMEQDFEWSVLGGDHIIFGVFIEMSYRQPDGDVKQAAGCLSLKFLEEVPARGLHLQIWKHINNI